MAEGKERLIQEGYQPRSEGREEKGYQPRPTQATRPTQSAPTPPSGGSNVRPPQSSGKSSQ